MKIWQEFYCGECDGYFRVRLNMAINMGVRMVCPNCKHEHHRFVENGVIYEKGRAAHDPKEKIYPPKSAYSKEPLTAKMATATSPWKRRDGVKIESKEDLNQTNPVAASFVRERWFELHGGK
jgi:hypothetical protein